MKRLVDVDELENSRLLWFLAGVATGPLEVLLRLLLRHALWALQ